MWEKQHPTYRHTHNRISIGWIGLVFGFSCVIIHEQGNHTGHGREGNICDAIHLFNVDNGLVHLAKRERSSFAHCHLQNLTTEHEKESVGTNLWDVFPLPFLKSRCIFVIRMINSLDFAAMVDE